MRWNRDVFLSLSLGLLIISGCSHSPNKRDDISALSNIINTKTCSSDSHVEENESCYKVCTDLHYYKTEIKTPNIVIHDNPNFKKRTFYIGDIFDLENAIQHANGRAKKEKVAKTVEAEIEKLHKALGNNYIRGNHEFYACQKCPSLTIANGILFTHGHHLCWHEHKVEYWESGKDKEVKKSCYKCKYECFEKAVELAKIHNDVHTIVFGHTHKKKFRRVEIERSHGEGTIKAAVSIINLPQGCFYLEISNPS